MRRRRIRPAPGLLASVSVLALLWGGCRDAGLAGGSGSQTTNTIAGVVVDVEGRPQGGVQIRTVPADFNPLGRAFPAALADTTDNRGRYSVSGLAPGRYTLEGRHAALGTGLLVAAIDLPAGGGVERVRDTLRPTGSLTLDLSARALPAGGYLYVPGTTYRVEIRPEDLERGSVSLDSLPPGDYPGLRHAQDTSLADDRPVLEGGFRVESGRDSALGPYASWKAAWKVDIDASAAGLNATEVLRGFPLFLDLHAGNFDFSLAGGAGADLRFTKSDGVTPVPFEIERWDSAGGKAAVWVRLDTLTAQGPAPFLHMYAGNPAAAGPEGTDGAGAAAPVFDTALGFAGVWHMHPDPAGRPGDAVLSTRDATPNGITGTALPGEAPQAAEGRLGPALLFDGRDDCLNLGASPALDIGGQLTIEAWIRPDRLPDSASVFRDGMVLARFDAYSLQIRADGTMESWLRMDTATEPYIQRPLSPLITPGAWAHVASVYDGGSFKVYVDGREASSQAVPARKAVATRHPLLVGYITGWQGYPRFFAGAIDEARVSRVARSPGWMALSYENQRQGSQVVTLRRLPR